VTDERDGEALDRDLAQMASNPHVARSIRSGLERMRGGAAGPVLAELARDLLSGRTTLREVGASSAYADQFREAARAYFEWRAGLPSDQQEELEKKAREEFGNGERDPST
jgi:hypothetical protein